MGADEEQHRETRMPLADLTGMEEPHPRVAKPDPIEWRLTALSDTIVCIVYAS